MDQILPIAPACFTHLITTDANGTSLAAIPTGANVIDIAQLVPLTHSISRHLGFRVCGIDPGIAKRRTEHGRSPGKYRRNVEHETA
ncbi:hypothetical protein I5699_36665 [Burkholderia cenocepacia]|nr:hypothetical protein [Burkholderia cenocepacia]MBJ9698591.1 hypothetical protein [Burkholderia cenocepacia]